MRRLLSWVPVAGWMLVVVWLSGRGFSGDDTGRLLEPLLAAALPGATPEQITALHALIRKLAHLGEYAILAGLWFRALGREAIPASSAVWIALFACATWAVVDETRQTLVPGRTGSPLDVGIDAAGAVAGLVVIRGRWPTALDRLTTALLWLTVVGGVVVILVNAVSGVRAASLWITTPVAALWLMARRRARASAGAEPRARDSGRVPQ